MCNWQITNAFQPHLFLADWMLPSILPAVRNSVLLRPHVAARSGLRHHQLESVSNVQETNSVGTAANPILVNGNVNDEAHSPCSLLDTNSEEDEDFKC
jgi:hypothetical protein